MKATTSTKNAKRPPRVRDDYLDLVRAFPLRPIRNDDEQARAVRAYGRLTARVGRRRRALGAGERDYADALETFIRQYDHHRPLPPAAMTPVEAVRFLMAQSGMNTEALGKVLGSQTAASLVLNGKRELSKRHVRLLAERFKVSPALFI